MNNLIKTRTYLFENFATLCVLIGFSEYFPNADTFFGSMSDNRHLEEFVHRADTFERIVGVPNESYTRAVGIILPNLFCLKGKKNKI